MPERSEAVEEQAVLDGAAVYSVEAEITAAEDVPPGYKRTEVGVIPEDWDIGCLGDFYEIKSSKRVLQRDWRRYGIPFYRTREVAILAEKGQVNNELHISEELYSVYANKYGVPKPGDVLVTGIGTIGKMYVVPDDRKFYFKDASIIWLKSRQSFDAAYLKQLFETRIIRNQLADASTGTTVDTYTISGANKTAVPVPRITEQRAIATALSDADALIESLDRLIAKKRAVKQAAMQQLLTGQTRLPGFTGEWETKRLGDVGTLYKGHGIRREDVSDEGVPCIRYGEIYTRYGDCVLMPESRIPEAVAETAFPLHCGDILFAGSGETADEIGMCVAYLGEQSAFAGGDIVVLRPNEGVSAFLGRLLNHPTIARQKARLGQGDAVVHISARNLAQIEVHLPGQEEQSAIATILSDMDTEIEVLERRREKSRQIKQGMMQQLLTGRVRVVEPETTEPVV